MNCVFYGNRNFKLAPSLPYTHTHNITLFNKKSHGAVCFASSGFVMIALDVHFYNMLYNSAKAAFKRHHICDVIIQVHYLSHQSYLILEANLIKELNESVKTVIQSCIKFKKYKLNMNSFRTTSSTHAKMDLLNRTYESKKIIFTLIKNHISLLVLLEPFSLLSLPLLVCRAYKLQFWFIRYCLNNLKFALKYFKWFKKKKEWKNNLFDGFKDS